MLTYICEVRVKVHYLRFSIIPSKTAVKTAVHSAFPPLYKGAIDFSEHKSKAKTPNNPVKLHSRHFLRRDIRLASLVLTLKWRK
jgi:hypothetical protein